MWHWIGVIWELSFKGHRWCLLSTLHGLLVLNWTGDLGAKLEWSPLPENLAFRLVSLSLH